MLFSRLALDIVGCPFRLFLKFRAVNISKKYPNVNRQRSSLAKLHDFVMLQPQEGGLMGNDKAPRSCLPVFYEVKLEKAMIDIHLDEDQDECFPVIFLYYTKKESPVMAHILSKISSMGIEPQINLWQTDKEDVVLITLELPNPDLKKLWDMGVKCRGSKKVVDEYLKRKSKIPILVVAQRFHLPWGSTRDFLGSFDRNGLTVLSVSGPNNIPIASCVTTSLSKSCPYDGE
jgi:hypothetical protein